LKKCIWSQSNSFLSDFFSSHDATLCLRKGLENSSKFVVEEANVVTIGDIDACVKDINTTK